MLNERKAPEIRFDGFVNDWISQKLGDLSEPLQYGLNAAAKRYDGDNKYLRITDIDDKSRSFLLSDITSPDIDFSSAENYLLQEGDVVFARTGASVGKTYRYKVSDGKVYFAGFLIRARISKNNDSECVFQNTLTQKYERFVRLTSQRSGQPGVNAQEYSGYEIILPEIHEQRAVGSFFTNLEDTIALKKQQYKQTVNIKKAMLEKMFPKKGTDVPEIRFEGFVRKWEVIRLDGLADIGDGLHGTPKYDSDGEYYFINGNNLDNGRITITSETKRIDGIAFGEIRIDFNENTIFMSINGTIGNVAFWNNEQIALGKSVAYFNINEMTIPQFAFYVLQTKPLLSYFNDSLTGTTIKNLGLNAIRSAEIIIPDLAEQTAIGNFFRNLDTLIEAQQEELDKLQTIKKACLSKMFV